MPVAPRSEVAANVRAEIARTGIRRDRVAAALGLSAKSVSRRLTGEVAIDVDELAALAALLDVPVTRLLGELAA